jgi:hypothetical protein
MITQNQLSLADIFSECRDIYESDKPEFLSLLQQHINLDEIVPVSFSNHFYASTGRTRKYPLYAMIWALIIQRIFSIPTDSLLLVFLQYSRHLREFCGFSKVPDASKITRFKQDFLENLEGVFLNLVDITEPICQTIDPKKALMTIFDSTGIEAYVKENNPKYANRVVKQLKAYAKAMGFDKTYDPYKIAYSSMPSHAATNPEVKQLYANGHFCYAYKAGIVTNGLGIIRHIAFYNQEFFQEHPEIVIHKKSESPDKDKSVADSRLLIPTLQDFFQAHPLINPDTFLGDAAFDSASIYRDLLSGDTFGTNPNGEGIHFNKAYIPLNKRAGLENVDYIVDENGFPCCPKSPDVPMKPEGTASLKNGVIRYKFVCPKVKWIKNDSTGKHQRRCLCDNPCSTAPSGRMTYVYPEKDLRTYPGTLRGTDEWDDTYKIRTSAERSINHIKDSFGLAGRKTQNEKTLKADLILAGITQLITVVLADKMNQHQYLRSVKPLVA